MSRKPVHRRLPSLRELFPDFRGLSPQDNHSAVIVETLRATIERVRQPHAVPFYSMREVADFFGVSLRGVVRAYERLASEGLLTKMRGSQTLVEGHKPQPHHPVRAVVGLPVELPTFVYGTDLRSFYIELEDELRRFHHLVNFIFTRPSEEASPDLARRILDHRPDIVLWWVPTTPNLPNFLQLQDAGVRLVGIVRERENLPFPMYRYNRERSLREAFEAWQREGIESIVVLRPTDERALYELNLTLSVLQQLSLRHSVVIVEDAELGRHVQSLCRRRGAGVVIAYHAWYGALCNRFPQLMEQLFCSCRVLLVQGAVQQAVFEGRNIPADVLSLDHQAMARQVARDMGAGTIWSNKRLATFYSRWEARLDLGKVSREM